MNWLLEDSVDQAVLMPDSLTRICSSVGWKWATDCSRLCKPSGRDSRKYQFGAAGIDRLHLMAPTKRYGAYHKKSRKGLGTFNKDGDLPRPGRTSIAMILSNLGGDPRHSKIWGRCHG